MTSTSPWTLPQCKPFLPSPPHTHVLPWAGFSSGGGAFFWPTMFIALSNSMQSGVELLSLCNLQCVYRVGLPLPPPLCRVGLPSLCRGLRRAEGTSLVNLVTPWVDWTPSQSFLQRDYYCSNKYLYEGGSRRILGQTWLLPTSYIYQTTFFAPVPLSQVFGASPGQMGLPS